jgi:hypothetical protein
MPRLANHYHAATLLTQLPRRRVCLGNVRAGRVDNAQAAGARPVDNIGDTPVRADDQHARLHIINTARLSDSALSQVADDLGVMDERSQRMNRARALPRRVINERKCPLDAITGTSVS